MRNLGHHVMWLDAHSADRFPTEKTLSVTSLCEGIQLIHEKTRTKNDLSSCASNVICSFLLRFSFPVVQGGS